MTSLTETPGRPDPCRVYKTACAALFKRNPVAYCDVVLGVRLTEQQQHIAELILAPPHKVLVKAAHNVGKSFLAACLTLWWYDCHDPGLVLTTAPTDKAVKNILWKEIRALRGPLGGFPGPAAPRLQDGSRHYAVGMVARVPEGFQGQHEADVFVVIDEAVGVEAPFWMAAETMLSAAFAICNPTNTSSYAYQAEESGTWTVVSLSALDHPNVAAELRGEAPPYPSAIRLARLDEMLRSWSAPVTGEPQPGDVEWPPGSGRWLRPGPEAEARLLGRWPSQAVNSVWGEREWLAVQEPRPDDGDLQLGLDVARFGDDASCCHVRKGPSSLDHQSRHGLTTIQTAALGRDLAIEWGQRFPDPRAVPKNGQRPRYDPKKVPIKVDDAGVGGGVTDQLRAWGYNAIPCLGAHSPLDGSLYPNRRSESWFLLSEQARAGGASFHRLSPPIRAELKRQLLGVTYSLDVAGRRVVEAKEKTKARLQRSPDDADAAILAYAPLGNVARVVGLGG